MKIFLKSNAFLCLTATLLLVLTYSNSFENTFQYDDFHVIVHNTSLKDSSFLKKLIVDFIKGTGENRLLLMASFSFNYLLGGINVLGYHLLNTIIHIFSSILVYFITLHFLASLHRIDDPLLSREFIAPRTKEEKDFMREKLISLFVALIFALHPVQTEAVAYITGRSSSLAGLFYLLSFFLYLKYRLLEKNFLLFLSFVTYVCALFVKESAITFPVVIIVFELMFYRKRSWNRHIYPISVYLGLTLLFLLNRLRFLGSLSIYQSLAIEGQPIRPLYDHLITQPRAWIHYLGTLLMPLNLSVDYSFPVYHSLFESEVIFSLIVLITLAIIILIISKINRIGGFFSLWFAINLLPTNSVLALEDIVTDRWLYLSTAGFAVILGISAERLFQLVGANSNRISKIIFFFLCFLFIELYSYGTLMRNLTWGNYRALWADTASKAPASVRAHLGLGIGLSQEGRIEEAIREYKKALQLNPKVGEAYLNLSYAYLNLGRLEEAIDASKRAIVLQPKLASAAHNNLGLAYFEQGLLDEAQEEFQHAISLKLGNDAPYYNLGLIYDREGDIDQAISNMERAIDYNPDYFLAWEALSRLYGKKGWKERSLEASKKHQKYLRQTNRSIGGLK